MEARGFRGDVLATWPLRMRAADWVVLAAGLSFLS